MNRFSPLRFLLPITLLLLGACAPVHESLSSTATTDTIRATKSVDGQGRTGIDGQIIVKETGAPLAGAYINVYPDAFTNLLGPSQFISRPTDVNGHYQIDLPPGTYYVVARKRMTGDPTGPLSPGDFYSEYHRVVTTVVAGRVALVDLAVVPMRAPMFFKKGTVEQETNTGIRGILVDGQGRPVPGGFAMAYVDANLQRLPDFPSTLSNEKGEFTIYLPKGGTYYLGGRIHVWDMPRPGEPYGKFGGETPTPVLVADDTFVEGIRIVLTPFAGTYEPGKSRRPF